MLHRRRRRLVNALLSVPIALGFAPAAAARGQGVVLQIRPRIGDTLHLRLDQQTELSGKRRLAGGEVATTTVVTTMRMFSRAIVQKTLPKATIVRAVTDSVRLTTTDANARTSAADTERMLEGRSMQLRIAPNGTVSVEDSSSEAPRELADVVALMPGTLPTGPVQVGMTWVREMPLPGGSKVAPGATSATGWLHAKFRLDSLAHEGTLAFISLRGEMTSDPDASVKASPGSGPVLERGSVSGTLVVDRRRGWLTESRFTILVHSSLRLPGAPDTMMRFETRVTQRMKTVDRR
jgi:hypothetical protein